MAEDQETQNKAAQFSQEVALQATRRLKARKAGKNVWFGFGMFGLIGWSVVVPTLLGAMLGIWLDGRYPGTHSWTVTLLIVGLFIGCGSAAHWVNKESREMLEEEAKDE